MRQVAHSWEAMLSSLESGDLEFNSERAFVARSLRGREEVPMQDDQDGVFDLLVVDSPDEVDIVKWPNQ